MKWFGLLISLTLCIPLPSNQHFIWPLDVCLLADICNHTWIPECAQERSDNSLRLFTDECDLYEYSCDYGYHYDILNYSECFTGLMSCPTTIPCPSNPTCPNHRFHRMGQRFFFVTEARRMARPIRPTTKINLPKHMLHGKRRYTPKGRCGRTKCQGNKKKTTVKRTILKNVKLKRTPKYPTTKRMASIKRKMMTKQDTIVIRRETVLKNGKMFVKVIKGIASKTTGTKTKEDSDFLEK